MTATKFLQMRQVEKRLLAALRGRRETFTIHQLYELCGIPAKDENAKFALRQVATGLAKTRKVKAVGGGMYRSMEPDAEPETPPHEPPVVEMAAPVEDVVVEEPLDVADSEPDAESDSEETEIVEETGRDVVAHGSEVASSTKAPRGAFRAWLLGYLRPNVILGTKDILDRALDAKVTKSRQAGQLALGVMAKRGDLRRVRKGYFSLPPMPEPAGQPVDAASASVALKEPPVLSVVPPPQVETRSEPETERGDSPEIDADLPPDPVMETAADSGSEKAKPATPKRKTSRAQEDVFARIDRMFRERAGQLRQRIMEGEAYEKELAAEIRKGERQLIDIKRCCTDAQALLKKIAKAREELARLGRSLCPRKRR
jgi:hypothetical protein